MLRAWVGSLALVSLTSASLGADEKAADISTWRWHVSNIANAQRANANHAPVYSVAFQQSYDRYSPVGLPESK